MKKNQVYNKLIQVLTYYKVKRGLIYIMFHYKLQNFILWNKIIKKIYKKK